LDTKIRLEGTLPGEGGIGSRAETAGTGEADELLVLALRGPSGVFFKAPAELHRGAMGWLGGADTEPGGVQRVLVMVLAEVAEHLMCLA
jgi:hypothetical protein